MSFEHEIYCSKCDYFHIGLICKRCENSPLKDFDKKLNDFFQRVEHEKRKNKINPTESIPNRDKVDN